MPDKPLIDTADRARILDEYVDELRHLDSMRTTYLSATTAEAGIEWNRMVKAVEKKLEKMLKQSPWIKNLAPYEVYQVPVVYQNVVNALITKDWLDNPPNFSRVKWFRSIGMYADQANILEDVLLYYTDRQGALKSELHAKIFNLIMFLKNELHGRNKPVARKAER